MQGDATKVVYTDSTFTSFVILFNILVIVLLVKVGHTLYSAGQNQGKLSTGFFLLKTLINYVIYFTLLSELYSHLW